MKRRTLVAVAAPLMILNSCAKESLTNDTYRRDEVMRMQRVERGRILELTPVKIEGDHEIGTAVGAFSGWVLGSCIGTGEASNVGGAVGGALVGGTLGSHVGQALGSAKGHRFIVRLKGGETMSIVQEVNPREPFKVGEDVRLCYMPGRVVVIH